MDGADPAAVEAFYAGNVERFLGTAPTPMS